MFYKWFKKAEGVVGAALAGFGVFFIVDGIRNHVLSGRYVSRFDSAVVVWSAEPVMVGFGSGLVILGLMFVAKYLCRNCSFPER